MILTVPVKVLALKEPFAVMICWFQFTELVPALKRPCAIMSDLVCGKGSCAQETLCNHDSWVPLKVPALKGSFAIIMCWFPSTGSGAKGTPYLHDFVASGLMVRSLKKPFGMMCWLSTGFGAQKILPHHDFLGSVVYWFRR